MAGHAIGLSYLSNWDRIRADQTLPADYARLLDQEGSKKKKWKRFITTTVYAEGSNKTNVKDGVKKAGTRVVVTAGSPYGFRPDALKKPSPKVSEETLERLKKSELGYLLNWDLGSGELLNAFEFEHFEVLFDTKYLILQDREDSTKFYAWKLSSRERRKIQKVLTLELQLRSGRHKAQPQSRDKYTSHLNISENQKDSNSVAAPPPYSEGSSSNLKKEPVEKATEKTSSHQSPQLAKKMEALIDRYSAETHNDIIDTIKGIYFLRSLPVFGSKTFKKRLRHLDVTLLSLLEHDIVDMSVYMLRLASAAFHYHVKEPEWFPTISWEAVEPALVQLLDVLVGRHGFLDASKYAAFYSAMLVTINLATGSRIKLDPDLWMRGPSQTLPTLLPLTFQDKTFEFPYHENWLPQQQVTRLSQTPEEDRKFETAKNLAARYVQGLQNGQSCGITELDFGYIEVRTSVLVAFTDPGCVFPDNYFARTFIHCENAILPYGISGAGPGIPPIEEQEEHSDTEEPKTTELPEYNTELAASEAADSFHTWLSSRATLEMKESKKLAGYDPQLAKSQVLAEWRGNLKDRSMNRLPITYTKYPLLFNGRSISLKDQLSRGSLGLFLECDESEGVLALTAGHVAPDLNTKHRKKCARWVPKPEGLGYAPVQTPGGLDMARVPISYLRATDNGFELSPKVNPSDNENACIAALKLRRVFGEVLASEIGAEHWPGYGWRIDHSLVKISNPEKECKNGFAFLGYEELLKFTNIIFENFGAGLESYGDSELLRHDTPDGHEERLKVFGSVGGIEEDLGDDARPDEGKGRVFKVGATTSLTTGTINKRRFYLYKKNSVEAHDLGPDIPGPKTSEDLFRFATVRGVDAVCFEVIVPTNASDVTDFCHPGDSGSAVFRLKWDYLLGEWKMVWSGSLVSQATGPVKTMGLMIPAQEQLLQLKKHTGLTLRPAP